MDIQFQQRQEPAIELTGFFQSAGFYQFVNRYCFGGERTYQTGYPAMRTQAKFFHRQGIHTTQDLVPITKTVDQAGNVRYVTGRFFDGLDVIAFSKFF